MAQGDTGRKVRVWLWSLGIAGSLSFGQPYLFPTPAKAGLLNALQTPSISLDIPLVQVEVPSVEVSVPDLPVELPVEVHLNVPAEVSADVQGEVQLDVQLDVQVEVHAEVQTKVTVPPPLQDILPAIEVDISGIAVETPIVDIGIPIIDDKPAEPAVPEPVKPPPKTVEPAVPEPVKPPPQTAEPADDAASEKVETADAVDADKFQTAEDKPSITEPTKEVPVQAHPAGKKPVTAQPVKPVTTAKTDMMQAPHSKPAHGHADQSGPVSKRYPFLPAGSKVLMPAAGTHSGGVSIGPAGGSLSPSLGLVSQSTLLKPPQMSIMPYERFRLYGASQWSKPPPLQPPRALFLS